MYTDYHAKVWSHELTRRAPSDSIDKLASAVAGAQVDLNPHQVDAALFAFRSPLSKGALLADEVGLGKTIEAGLVLSQRWAEHKRRILIITPANLRKQWLQERAEKFFLPGLILEARSCNAAVRSGQSPFEPKDSIVLCSYAPSETVYWQHGHSTERDFVYVTTATLTHEQLAELSDEVGPERSLLVLCTAFRARADAFANLTIKKIPHQVLSRFEWGKDDYSLNVANLPQSPETDGWPAPHSDALLSEVEGPPPAGKGGKAGRRKKAAAQAAQAGLFGEDA
jgi:hypothetical protein